MHFFLFYDLYVSAYIRYKKRWIYRRNCNFTYRSHKLNGVIHQVLVQADHGNGKDILVENKRKKRFTDEEEQDEFIET